MLVYKAFSVTGCNPVHARTPSCGSPLFKWHPRVELVSGMRIDQVPRVPRPPIDARPVSQLPRTFDTAISSTKVDPRARIKSTPMEYWAFRIRCYLRSASRICRKPLVSYPRGTKLRKVKVAGWHIVAWCRGSALHAANAGNGAVQFR